MLPIYFDILIHKSQIFIFNSLLIKFSHQLRTNQISCHLLHLLFIIFLLPLFWCQPHFDSDLAGIKFIALTPPILSFTFPSPSIHYQKTKTKSILIRIFDSLATLIFEVRQRENGGYAHFGSAYRRFIFMTNARRWTVLFLYALSIGLSLFLLYMSIVQCHYFLFFGRCHPPPNRQKLFSEHLAIVVSIVIVLCSFCWLIANFKRIENSCLNNYNFLEMPTAVLCSLLAGICGVVEIHYNFDYSQNYDWTEKWALITTDAVALVCLHAGLAFALT